MSALATVNKQHLAENTYIVGVKFFDEVCGELCNHEMKAKCRGCRIFLMADNYAFHYSMNWFSLMQTELENWRKSRNFLINKTRKEGKLQ